MTKIKIEDLDGCTVRVVDGKITYRRITQVTDGGLLGRFAEGNLPAIREVCGIVAERLAGDGLRDSDLTDLLIPVFQAIADGTTPDKAFNIPKRRPKQNYKLRDWQMQLSVQKLMRDKGISLTEACETFAADRTCTIGAKSLEAICKRLTEATDLPMPSDIYPIG